MMKFLSPAGFGDVSLGLLVSGKRCISLQSGMDLTDAPASYDWLTSGVPEKVKTDLTIPFLGAML